MSMARLLRLILLGSHFPFPSQQATRKILLNRADVKEQIIDELELDEIEILDNFELYEHLV